MALRDAPESSPPIKSGSELDWVSAKAAAEDIVAECNKAFFAPPELTEVHLMRIDRVCQAMNAIVDALRLRKGPGHP